MKSNRFYNGFTIVELIIGITFTSAAALAIMVGTSHYYSTITNLKLKEAAYERLKSYTELKKGLIASGELNSNSGNSCESGEELSLGSISGSSDEDWPRGWKANELCHYVYHPIELEIYGLDSDRYELLTTIKWDNINDIEQEMSFYAIQLVYQ